MKTAAIEPRTPGSVLFAAISERTPPHVYFVGSAVFHYFGPAFAVLLFAHVAPLGVAWLRIATRLLFSPHGGSPGATIVILLPRSGAQWPCLVSCWPL